jgi:metal-dependent HD superfamily phosphatase/phosphodiesterase
MITYETIKASPEIRTYIEKADENMLAIGYTEHAFAHVAKCAQMSGDLLLALGYGPRTAELARIAAYMHDIGNVVNRAGHAGSGALMAFRLLDSMGMDPAETAAVVSAIGHHDEETAFPVNAVAAALILADKSDVRRSRVRPTDPDTISHDIHDRVNYAVESASLALQQEESAIRLELSIDTTICAVMDYFEIFLGRMLLCRKAANFFGLKFQLVINGVSLL